MFDELPEGNYDISTFMDDNGDIIGIYIYSILFYIILYIIVIIDTIFLGIYTTHHCHFHMIYEETWDSRALFW